MDTTFIWAALVVIATVAGVALYYALAAKRASEANANSIAALAAFASSCCAQTNTHASQLLKLREDIDGQHGINARIDATQLGTIDGDRALNERITKLEQTFTTMPLRANATPSQTVTPAEKSLNAKNRQRKTPSYLK